MIDQKNKELLIENLLNELNDVSRLVRDLASGQHDPILALSLIRVTCFYIVEAANYTNVSLSSLGYSKIYKDTRNKLKGYKDPDTLFKTTQKYIDISRKFFESKTPKLPKYLIDDIGIFYIEETPIANTISLLMYNSHLYGKTLAPPKDEIAEVSSEIASALAAFSKPDSERILPQTNIKPKDKRLLSSMDPTFNPHFRTDKTFIYLDALCTLNLCKTIIPRLDSTQDFKIRITLIFLHSSLQNLRIANSVITVNGLNELLDKYTALTNRTLRNGILHLDYTRDLKGPPKKNRLFEGLVESTLSISDSDFLDRINNDLSPILFIMLIINHRLR